ncbi:chorismate-binding protein [Ekhidna sp.]|uniref:chorismate-binding protein n=1 Tax=Ekhidna sp. TaxID=2608089 RepID=UPI003C7A5559
MTELATILQLEKPDILIRQLEQAGYAFAVWKKPGDEDIRTFISLKEVTQLESFQLDDLEAGFLINAYSDNHPIKPFHIAADLIIHSNEIAVAPNVSDSQIDAFKERIKDTRLIKNKGNNPKNEDTFNSFEQSVSKAIAEIKKGTFEKVVLSRYRDETLPDNFSSWSFFQTICEKYTNAFCSISHIPGKGLWIGATPELMISDNSERFKTVSLAGTKPLSDGQPLSEIAWTQKEIEEQAMVSRYVINCFKKIRLREFHEHGPKTVKAGSLAHLKTEFIVNYEEVQFEELADQMLELLHPTSAVCGMPIDQTKPWIQQEEQYDREFYSGFLGPVNFENSTDLYVNLRCMKMINGNVRFFAGAGITEDSDPHKEYEETEMKMNILKSKLL